MGDLRDFSLLTGGPLYRFYLRTGLARAPLKRTGRRIAAAVLAWLPLCVLTLIAARSTPEVVGTFVHDIEIHLRFLLVVPLFIAAEAFADSCLGPALAQFPASN